MIELVRDLRVINVLAKFENDPWKIMDVRVLTGLVCPAARPLGVRQYPGALKGCGVKTKNFPSNLNHDGKSSVKWARGLILVQAMACFLTSPSNYLNNCWLLSSGDFGIHRGHGWAQRTYYSTNLFSVTQILSLFPFSVKHCHNHAGILKFTIFYWTQKKQPKIRLEMQRLIHITIW